MPDLRDIPEPDLLRAAQGGDIAAFSRLVEIHHARVRACLAVRMNQPSDAEDLAQEVFLTAFRKLAEVDASRPLGPWLRGVAMHLLANHRRKFRAIPVGLNEELQALVDARPAFAEREPEVMFALRECLDRLEGPARRLIRERYEEGVSLEDLAARLGRKTSAVSMQLHRLRVVLGDCMGQSRPAVAP